VTSYAPQQDRKGRDLHPGDRVRVKAYPRGTLEGIIVVSPRARVVLLDGSTAPALVVDVEGTLFSLPSPKGVLKLGSLLDTVAFRAMAGDK
jgi:protein involved in polysaccharide export with SLBB domain